MSKGDRVNWALESEKQWGALETWQTRIHVPETLAPSSGDTTQLLQFVPLKIQAQNCQILPFF